MINIKGNFQMKPIGRYKNRKRLVKACLKYYALGVLSEPEIARLCGATYGAIKTIKKDYERFTKDFEKLKGE